MSVSVCFPSADTRATNSGVGFPLPISPITEMTGPCHQVHLFFKVVNSSSFMNMYGNPKIYIYRHQMHSGSKGDQKRALDTPKLNLLMIMSQSLGFGTRTQVF